MCHTGRRFQWVGKLWPCAAVGTPRGAPQSAVCSSSGVIQGTGQPGGHGPVIFTGGTVSHTTGKRGLQLLVFSHYWVVFAFRTVDGIRVIRFMIHHDNGVHTRLNHISVSILLLFRGRHGSSSAGGKGGVEFVPLCATLWQPVLLAGVTRSSFFPLS